MTNSYDENTTNSIEKIVDFLEFSQYGLARDYINVFVGHKFLHNSLSPSKWLNNFGSHEIQKYMDYFIDKSYLNSESDNQKLIELLEEKGGENILVVDSIIDKYNSLNPVEKFKSFESTYNKIDKFLKYDQKSVVTQDELDLIFLSYSKKTI